MAEVRKRKTDLQEYKIDDNKEEEVKTGRNKIEKKAKKVEKTEKMDKTKEKKSLWTKFRIFCHGVVNETKKVHWPTKGDMFKYSIATIIFIVFCSLFFYLIEVIFAFVQTLF